MLNNKHLLLFTLFVNLGLSVTVLPLAQAERVEQVVIISFDGLRADALTSLGPADLPTFDQVIQEGASTLNARTDYDKTETLPNHTTMLTGRGVKGNNGHEYDMNDDNDPNRTLHSVKGNYVHSLFDVAHDHGLKTALLASKDKFAVYYRSYDENNGAPDVIGVEDNGKKKIDIWEFTDKDDPVTWDNFFDTITLPQPPQLIFLHFSGPDKIGHAAGWDITLSSQYMNTVKEMDTFLQQVLAKVPSKTVVIITADHGGGDPIKGHHLVTKSVNYTIPFLVWDNMDITQPNGDLYNLNPIDYTDPGIDRPDYNQAQQPIRNGDVANLALSLLCLPNVPDSFIKGKLALNNYPNRAPLLNSSTPSLTPINEDDINPTGMVVADLITGLITELDFSCALEGIAVIAVDNSNGSWEYSIDTGSTWQPFGSPSASQARLLAADTQIRFIPHTDYYGQASMSFRAWDQTSGSHGGIADATNFGDPTAFSSNTVTANITINAVNDAPSFIVGSDPSHVVGSSGSQMIPSWATAMNPGAANESNQILTFHVTIISDPNQVLTTVPAINNTGDLNYTLTGNSGAAQLEVVLQDDGGTTLGGVDTSSATPFTITVNSDSNSNSGNNPSPILNPTSSFTPGLKPLPPTMKLSVLLSGSGKGRVTSEPQGIDCDNNGGYCQQVYETASWVKLIPIAMPGSKFRVWGGQSDCEDGEVFMNAIRGCIAYFDLLSANFTVNPIDNGTITSYPPGISCGHHSGQCSHRFNVGTNLTLTVTPDAGWQLAGWEGNCDETGQTTLTTAKHCQPILVPITANLIPDEVNEVKVLEEIEPSIANTDTVLTATPIAITPEEVVSPPTTATNITTEEISVVVNENEAEILPNPSTPTIAPTIVTSVAFTKPMCPLEGWLNWVCNAQKQTITHLEIGPNGNLANGILAGTINSQGWTSNLIIQPQAILQGGIVTGYIQNQGTMSDFIFRGALIQGGILSGTILNDSPIDGRIQDVQLAANTYLSGGKLGGNIIGEVEAPAWLEHLEITAGSYLEHVKIGAEVELAANVTFGEDVHFISTEE
jgi:hypothetical protein